MKKPMMIAGLLGLLCASLAGAADESFLEKRGTEFYLGGKPFYEISFNKFDLMWELMGAEVPPGNQTGFGPDPGASAEAALKKLGGLGFKTLRVFCGVPEAYFDPARRERYLANLDRMLAMCDQHGLRLVFCFNAESRYYAQTCGETYRDTIVRPDSQSRAMVNQLVRDLVTRYRDRKTIAMWENTNELLLMADIGGKSGVWNGIACPSLPEVAQFHADLAKLIHSIDSRHPVTTGDSFRYSQWHLYQAGNGDGKNMWGRDTLEELDRAVSMSQKGMDVYCIHYYDLGVHGGNEATGADGKPVLCRPADFKRFAAAMGQPLYIGEFGALPRARNDKNHPFWEDNPDWFTSFTNDRAGRQGDGPVPGADRRSEGAPDALVVFPVRPRHGPEEPAADGHRHGPGSGADEPGGRSQPAAPVAHHGFFLHEAESLARGARSRHQGMRALRTPMSLMVWSVRLPMVSCRGRRQPSRT